MTTKTSAKARKGASASEAPTQNAGAPLNLARMTKEQMFTEIEDGNGFKIKVANMNNPLICPRKGVVQFESIKKTAYKQTEFSFTTAYDPIARVTYGIPIGLNPVTKRIIWQRFYVSDFREYDLKNERDAVECAIFSRLACVQGSMFQKGRLSFRKYDVDAIADEAVRKITMSEEAIGIVKNMKLKDWIPLARFLGKVPENLSESRLRQEVFETARNNPDEILNYWHNTSRQLIDLFHAGKAVGVIHFDVIQGWMYKRTMPIGKTEALAIDYISKDATFASGLLSEVKSKDRATRTIQGKDVNADNDLNSFANQDNQEFTTLQMKAQMYRISGYQEMDIEELREQVKQAESDGGSGGDDEEGDDLNLMN